MVMLYLPTPPNIMSKAYEFAIPLDPPGSEAELPPNIPAPARRHGSPSGPWPWLDINYDKERTLSLLISYNGQEFCPHESDKQCGDECWIRYPESIFSNWLPSQVKRSRIKELSYISPSCTIYYIDVGNDGSFSDTGHVAVSSYSKEDQVNFMAVQVVMFSVHESLRFF